MKYDVIDVIGEMINVYVGCRCDSTLQGWIWSKEIGKFTGELREMLFEKTFSFFSRKKTIGGPWNTCCLKTLPLVHSVQQVTGVNRCFRLSRVLGCPWGEQSTPLVTCNRGIQFALLMRSKPTAPGCPRCALSGRMPPIGRSSCAG